VLFQNTGKPDKFAMIEKSWFQGDLNEGLMLMTEGDSATFIVCADSLRKMGMQLPEFVKEDIRYTVKLHKILTLAQQNAEKKLNQEKELVALEKYIAEQKITVAPSASGLYFIELKKGNGAKVESGKTVQFNYTGALLNGKIFDSSNEKEAFDAGIGLPQREYKPLEIQAGVGQVIPGMDEALMQMKVGSKAKVIIPSSLAYGEQGNASFPAYSTLVFTIEVVGVK
ncbi:MAG: FKBP-type peptidyl-prolyl cis-trans isomerase, partial [Bacteroidales bacterium]